MGILRDESTGILYPRRELPERLLQRMVEARVMGPDVTPREILEELREAVPDCWTMPEDPLAGMPRQCWVALYRRVGFITDGPEQPTETLTIYSGTRYPRVAMAWSLDRSVAQKLARRAHSFGRHDAAVWTATVDPANVLARFSGREENEVVVDPRGVRGRHRLSADLECDVCRATS